MSSLARWNDQVTFIFICVDCFSRKAFARALLNKTTERVTAAANDIFDSLDKNPKIFQSDLGKEFVSVPFQAMLKRRDIEFQNPKSELKCPLVERLIQSITKRIGQYLTEKQSRRYIHRLQNFVTSYNETAHRSLEGLTPEYADLPSSENEVSTIQSRRYSKLLGKKRKIRFSVGEKVRVKVNWGRAFAKNYDEKFSSRLYEIVNVSERLPVPMYTLKDLATDEVVKGNFYANEIQLVDTQDNIYKVEKVLKTRYSKQKGKEYLIKWLNYPEEEATWEPAANILQRFREGESTDEEND